MYYIYTDEAGTSKNEPVSVVVGIVTHADRHWRAALELLNHIKDRMVPAELRSNFFFHAKDIRSGYREYDKSWTEEDRFRFIAEVASIPRQLGMAVALGKVRRDWELTFDPAPLKPHEYQHVVAFWYCMLRANKYVRDWGAKSEIATVVAENVAKMHDFLKVALGVEFPDMPMDDTHRRLTAADRAAGRILQTDPGKIDRIIDTVHFVGKREAPLIQIADACAFTFRRYFAGQPYGPEMVRIMLGVDLVWDDWQGVLSQMVFSFDPDHRYPTRI